MAKAKKTKTKPEPKTKAKKKMVEATSAEAAPTFEYPPFGTKEFWDRHERARLAKLAKEALGREIRTFIDELVARHGKGRDPRRDIAWFMSQYGASLLGDVEREKREKRDTGRSE